MKKKKLSILVFLFSVLILNIQAQEFSIPHFETTALFYGTDSKPYISSESSSSIKLRFRPSHILYFDMGMSAQISNLIRFFANADDNKNNGSFEFSLASINFPHIKNKPVSMSIFTGTYDYLGSDAILQEHLKIKLEGQRFRKYFPASAFTPENRISGTGFALYGAFPNGLYGAFYNYWNNGINEQLKIITDLRLGGQFDFFTFDFFAGVGFPVNPVFTTIRAGINMLFTSGTDYELFAEAGIADLILHKPSIKDVTSNIYASFEARINKKIFFTSIACFISPVFLLPLHINEKELKNSFFAGLSSIFSFGNIYVHNMAGGISILASVNPMKPALITPFSFSLSPFYTFILDKFEIDLRVPISPLMYNDIKHMFKGQITLKAVY